MFGVCLAEYHQWPGLNLNQIVINLAALTLTPYLAPKDFWTSDWIGSHKSDAESQLEVSTLSQASTSLFSDSLDAAVAGEPPSPPSRILRHAHLLEGDICPFHSLTSTSAVSLPQLPYEQCSICIH